MKKIISVFLVFLFIASFFGDTALAVEPIEYYCTDAFSNMVDMGSKEKESTLSGFEKVNYYSSPKKHYQKYNSFTLLNEKQLEIYNKIKNSPIGTMSVSLEYQIGEFKTSEISQEFFDAIMDAVCNDLPQFFYHAGYQVGYSRTSTGYVLSIDYHFKMIEVNMSINGQIKTAVPTYSAETLAECWGEIEQVLNSVAFDTSNRYNFVKSVHDYLCDNVIYPDFTSDYYVGDCHDAYGALVNGYAVCQGYADAFKLICDRYNVPCVFITGEANGGGHAWNAVQMDDGMWYFIDATWDDQEWKTFYEFFLVGSQTVDNGFENTAFSVSHVNDADLFLPALNYATEKYSETDHNTAFKATYNSIAKEDGKYLIRTFFDAEDSYLYYDGMYVESENLTTNGTFSIHNNDTSIKEDWTLVLIGDCNGDGSCNDSDLSDVVNKVLADADVVAAYDMAADADCDGSLDVIDISLIERAISGSNTNIILE